MDASFCCKCKDRTCLKTGRPCKDVEKYLRDNGIYSRDWIRPRVNARQALRDGKGKWREIPFSMLTDIPLDKTDLLEDKAGR